LPNWYFSIFKVKEINMDIDNSRETLDKILRNDEEQKFEIKAELGDVDIPYSYVTDDAGKLGQIVRLLRKGVEPDTILAFYEMHLR
jgi:hypothetical protein